MIWTYYWLRFRLLSPLHIGYRKVGNLMQTRPYVPGKVLWAALTARITRDDHDGSQDGEYKRIGDLVEEYFRFGYLWPSLDDGQPYFPWKHDDFDYLLLGSYASTALNYNWWAAEEGTLHETEYIAPIARNGRPVYLVGDLWVRSGDAPGELKGWREAFQKLQFGGERTYGWGWVRCCTDWQKGRSGKGKTIAGYTWEERNGEVVLTVSGGERLTAHALAADFSDDDNRLRQAVRGVEGSIEPLVGRETMSDGQWGVRVSPACICYTPGSLVKAGATFRIGLYGIWEAANGESPPTG